MSLHHFQWNLPEELFPGEPEITVYYDYHAGNGKTPGFPGDPDADPSLVEDVRFVCPTCRNTIRPGEDCELGQELERACWDDVDARKEPPE